MLSLPPCPEHQAVFLSWPWPASFSPIVLIDALLKPEHTNKYITKEGN